MTRVRGAFTHEDSGKDGLLGEIDETLSKTPLVLADEGRNLRRICCTCSRRVMARSGHIEASVRMSAFGTKRTSPEHRDRLDLTRMMLWTAPTLRHQGAIGWLRRNEPLEGSRPWARLARLVSISRSRFFTFTAWTPLARYDAVECDPWAHGRVRLYLRKGSQWHGRSAQDRR